MTTVIVIERRVVTVSTGLDGFILLIYVTEEYIPHGADGEADCLDQRKINSME